MAGSLPWKPPPPLPIPYLLGERIEAEPSPLGEKAPFWAVRVALQSEAGGAGLPQASGNAGAPGLPWSGPVLGAGASDFRE